MNEKNNKIQKINFRKHNLNPINIMNGYVITDLPAQMVCSKCKNYIMTNIVRRNGMFSWLLATGLCLVGCLPCSIFTLFYEGNIIKTYIYIILYILYISFFLSSSSLT